MPKPALGKSRPKQTEDISQPVFLYTDAVPRDDLRSLDNSSRNRPAQSTGLDFQRPRTPTRHGRERKDSTHAPDLQKPLPPLKPPVRNHAANLSENTIGIALGSPRLVESQSAPSTQERTQRKIQDKRRLTRIDKSGKWKKIRNLFKAKEALASPPPQPFYQLDTNRDWLAQDSTDSVNIQTDKEAREANDETEDKEDEWPMVKRDQEDQKAHAITSDQVQKPEPMLQIDIPDVQLPRYSVMFSGLLGPRRRSIRRSNVPPTLATGHAASYSEPAIASPEMLPPPRRTDTPTRTKSPSFSLFPATQVSKASRVLGSQNLPLNPSPLARPRTASPPAVEEKPETKFTEQKTNQQDSLVVMVRSPPLPMPHRPQFSERSSSITSITSSQSEKIFAHDTPPLGLPLPPRPIFPERSSSFAFGQGGQSAEKPAGAQAASEVQVKVPVPAKTEPGVKSGPETSPILGSEPNPEQTGSPVSAPQVQNQQPAKKRKHKPKPPSLNLVSSFNPQPKPQVDKPAVQKQRAESNEGHQPRKPQHKLEKAKPPPLSLVPGIKSDTQLEKQSQRELETDNPEPQTAPPIPAVEDGSDKPTRAKPSRTEPNTDTNTSAKPPTTSTDNPKIEVSTARSISLSKNSGHKQIVVPINARKAETLRPEEKVVGQKAKTPQVMEGQHGHRHVKSQGVVIESV